MSNRPILSFLALSAALTLGTAPLVAQAATSTPEEILGHAIGADYVLPDYSDFTRFVEQLESESPRVKVVGIGPTAEGRTQLMTIITSPENHARLDHYRGIAERHEFVRCEYGITKRVLTVPRATGRRNE